MKKIKLSIFLSVFVLIVLAFVNKVEATNVINTDRLIEELGGGEYATVDGEKVKLEQDVELSKELVLEKLDVTLDLNGHKIKNNGNLSYIFENNGGNLTITDNTTNVGTIENGYGYTVRNSSGNLTIEKGKFISNGNSPNIYIMDGRLTIKNGNFSSKYACVSAQAGEIIINGGIYKTNSETDSGLLPTATLEFSRNTLEKKCKVVINGGEFYGKSNCIEIEGADVHITEGKYTAEQGMCLDITNSYTRDKDEKIEGQVVIDGGDFSSKKTCVGAGMREVSSDNGETWYKLASTIQTTINGGSFTSKDDVAVCLTGTILRINDGTFTGLKSGLLVWEEDMNIIITGGTFTANSSDKDEVLGGIAICLLENGKSNITAKNVLAEGYNFYDDKTISEKKYVDEVDEYGYAETYYLNHKHNRCSCTVASIKVEKKRYNISISEIKNGKVEIGKSYAVERRNC